MKLPKKGTVERAAYDAAHARWCGDHHVREEPGCREWKPDERELIAVIQAVREHVIKETRNPRITVDAGHLLPFDDDGVVNPAATACGMYWIAEYPMGSNSLAAVTCGNCRRTKAFKNS